jgi:hypothetical protein
MIQATKIKSFSHLDIDIDWSDDIIAQINALSVEERNVFFLMMYETFGENAPPQSILLAKGEEYDRTPVDVRAWLEDPYYMGEVGKGIYGPWKSDLIELFESNQYDEAVIVGSIGSGKTTFAHLAVIRMLYEASCLKNPQASYGLSKGSTIGFCNISTSKDTARRVVFEGLMSKINESPYFKYEFAPKKTLKEEVLFPKGLGLIAGSSTETSIIGMNIFGGILDEGNFMTRVLNRQQAEASQARWGHFTQAGRLYDTIKRRMKSRFQKKGKLPGILIVASSKTTQDSFTEQLIRQGKAEKNNRMFVRDRAIIDVKKDFFSDKTFKVLVGNEKFRSKILEPDEDMSIYGDDPTVVEIPDDLRQDFISDIDAALRDLAGVSTMAISSFFSNVEAVEKIYSPNLSHPFVCALNGNPTEWDGQLPYRIAWDQICSRNDANEWLPKRSPNAKRYVHLDPAKSGDAFGIAIGHISEWIIVPRQEGDSEWVTEKQPVFEVDFMLRIKAHLGEEIQFRNVRKLLYEFSAHGFHLAKISTDTYQSVDMIQTLTSKGYNAGLLSTDTSKEPYRLLRSVIYEKRLRTYRYSILDEELKKLEDTPQKIDHPKSGCFVGTTRIPLLDGTCPMIEELAGKEVWVYSSTPDGRIVPGKARGRYTKHVTELVDVVLDSGAVVRCTPDHRWMMRDGSYKEAKDLDPGIDRLMPIYRAWPINGGYERLSDKFGDRHLTHHLVAKAMGNEIPDGHVVHHKNHIKTDNRPENLEVVCHKQHCKSHTKERHQNDKLWRSKLYDGAQKFNLSEDGKRKHSEALSKTMRALPREEFLRRQRLHKTFRRDIDLSSLEKAKHHPDVDNANVAGKLLGCGRNVIMRVLRENGFNNWSEFSQKETGLNHKVRYVIPVKLNDPVAVYDLEVDEWHNFALSEGVFVHNSKDLADALCGMVFSAFSENSYEEGLSPVKGASVSENNIPKPDENFQERVTSTTEGALIIPEAENQVKVYQKKPKTLAPSYNKIGNDGKVENLVGNDKDPYFFDRG